MNLKLLNDNKYYHKNNKPQGRSFDLYGPSMEDVNGLIGLLGLKKCFGLDSASRHEKYFNNISSLGIMNIYCICRRLESDLNGTKKFTENDTVVEIMENKDHFHENLLLKDLYPDDVTAVYANNDNMVMDSFGSKKYISSSLPNYKLLPCLPCSNRFKNNPVSDNLINKNCLIFLRPEGEGIFISDLIDEVNEVFSLLYPSFSFVKYIILAIWI